MQSRNNLQVTDILRLSKFYIKIEKMKIFQNHLDNCTKIIFTKYDKQKSFNEALERYIFNDRNLLNPMISQDIMNKNENNTNI